MYIVINVLIEKKNSHTMRRFIIFMFINQDDDDIDYKCYAKKIRQILLFWIIENCDYLKMKQNNEIK